MNNRIRQFTFITYPESMGDIYDKISSLGIMCVRSPLHDRDFNIETGEIKKAHYHNMILLNSLKSVKQINELCESLGIKHYEIPYDYRAMLRYFCHLDEEPNSPKALYSIDDVKCFGGFDYNSVLTAKDGKITEHTNLINFIRKKGEFGSFRAFVDIIADERPNYLQMVIDKAYFYSLYIGYNVRDQNK